MLALRRFVGFTAVLSCFCAAFAPAFAFAQTVPEEKPPTLPVPVSPNAPTKNDAVQSLTIRLRFLKPSDFVASIFPSLPPLFKAGEKIDGRNEAKKAENQLVLLPVGLLRVSPDDAAGRVFVQGTPNAVTRLQALAALLDVEPKPIQIRVRILRGPIEARVRPLTQLTNGIVVTNVSGTGRNNQTLVLQAIGDGELFRVSLTPHANGDGSITLTAALSEISNFSTGGITHPETSSETRLWSRRISSGERVIAASVPNFKDTTTQYYLEITSRLGAPTAADGNAEDTAQNRTAK